MSYTGSIKSFNPERGWGHIECEETFSSFGKDVFLLRSQLKGTTAVQKGQTVTFNLTDNGRGPEATDVTPLGGVPGIPPMILPSSAVGNGGNGSSPNYMGIIKSFNPNSGWGHITCEQTEQMYGKDMFFMKSQLPGGSIQPGATVQFTVSQGIKGPEARNINPMGGYTPTPSSSGKGGNKGGGKGGGKGYSDMASIMPSFVGPSKAHTPMAMGGCGGSGNPHSTYFGTVKSFNDEKGWGHISCPHTYSIYGKDMFVMRSALNGNMIREGDSVQFSVTLGLKGPEATNVRVMGQVDEQQIYMGTIKMFNQEKGWGFITCDDTHRMFGKDIFVHKKDLGGTTPSPGDAIQFQVTISPDGRPEATSVHVSGGCYVAWKTGGMEGQEELELYGQAPVGPPIRPGRKGQGGFGAQRAGPYV